MEMMEPKAKLSEMKRNGKWRSRDRKYSPLIEEDVDSRKDFNIGGNLSKLVDLEGEKKTQNGG